MNKRTGVIDKILSYKSLFYSPKGVQEAHEFIKNCKDAKGLTMCLTAMNREAFKDLVLVYGLKNPQNNEALSDFLKFVENIGKIEQK